MKISVLGATAEGHRLWEGSLPLYTVEQVYRLDQAAIDAGTPGLQLMKRAAQAGLDLLVQLWPEEIKQGITVYCGSGKNGGDGYVLAALAQLRQLNVVVIALTPAEKLTGEPKAAYEFAKSSGVKIYSWSQHTINSKDKAPSSGVIVDALLGIGLTEAPRIDFANAIQEINSTELKILAIDIPSGLNANTGSAAGALVNADATITFIGTKRGLVTGVGPGVCGEIFLHRLGISDDILQQEIPENNSLSLAKLKKYLPPRARDSHKGNFGHVLIVGGDHGMGGAVIMSALAAARSGAGLVSVATRPEHVSPLLTRSPEIMVKGLGEDPDIQLLIKRASVIVIGPGLGHSHWAQQLLKQALQSELPLVLDADALNLIASGEIKIESKNLQCIATPHPAEAARLLNCKTTDINVDRFLSAKKIQQRLGGAVVLKGAGSIVSTNQKQEIVLDGNPGMATGGMGDVLSGILGALLAQGLSVDDAARLGAVAHACAGDLAAQELGERGLMATDLIGEIQKVLN